MFISIFKELKTSKSIYKAIDSTNSWDDVYNEIDMINDQVSLGTNIDEIKEMTEKYDQQISKYICKGWSKFIK
jgi:biotin synthase-like enzyme